MTTAFERIRDEWVPIWLKGFEGKSRDYNSATTGWEPHEVLGVKGQFADLWRKVGKLKKALWDGEALEGEQPLEIIDDLISHLFLTRDMLLREEGNLQGSSRGAEEMSTSKTPTDLRSTVCGADCSPRLHRFEGDCRYRLRNQYA